MKIIETRIALSDLFYVVVGLSEDNGLKTVDDLCDYLEEHEDEVYTVVRYARGESHDN